MARILVIDDETSVLKSLDSLLTAKGHQVITAVDGQSGMDKAMEEKPDLIILDILMPGIQGTAVAKYLEETPDTENIPIIFVTALAAGMDEKDIEMQSAADGHIFVAKPFKAENLFAAMDKALGGK